MTMFVLRNKTSAQVCRSDNWLFGHAGPYLFIWIYKIGVMRYQSRTRVMKNEKKISDPPLSFLILNDSFSLSQEKHFLTFFFYLNFKIKIPYFFVFLIFLFFIKLWMNSIKPAMAPLMIQKWFFSTERNKYTSHLVSIYL